MAKGTTTTGRKNKGIAKANHERRRAEAIERQEKHDKLTVRQKLEKLDKRLGAFRGADKERTRLTRKLTNQKKEV